MELSTATSSPISQSPADLVDLARYPVLDLDSAVAQRLIADGRAQRRNSGAAELPGFIRPEALAHIVAESEALVPLAYRSTGYGTAYIEVPDFSLPETHPRRYFGRYAVGVIAYDQFPAGAALRGLYEWEPMMEFIGAILDRGPLFRYADPLGALNLAVMTDGDELQWHFDQTDFVVSLALQDADEGGDFEVAPHIRRAGEECYDEVGRVFRGESERVVRLPMTPGTLLVFEGRHSVHRVSPIRGGTPRLVALLAYDTKPGTCSSDLLRQSRYGRLG